MVAELAMSSPYPPPLGEGRVRAYWRSAPASGCNGFEMNDPPRILVVDDSEENRDIIVTRLRAHGYETAEAADAR